jgi:hypothetical protein
MYKSVLITILIAASSFFAAAQEEYSGIYPHLAYFNNEGECGTGAVVPWAERLWVITYAPHSPKGSSDKLHEITPDLELIVRPESIGGTPANRMIHRESKQLFIGPYVIDAKRKVRVIPYAKMFGRLTGNARHLTDPENKIYCATMEEGLYEIDVHSLDVITLYHDEQVKQQPKAGLSGYHGKGLYSGQGRLIYANNGEHGGLAQKNPFVPSGVLAEWDGSKWNVVLRNQFTEVTGPNGIYGSEHPSTDPIWCVGWDAQSLILMLLDNGKWHKYRLPKASHSYDGAHGWNTEWPRIRDIGEKDLLMTMHGMFWRFPKMFTSSNSVGITPRSSYLKVVGDFCRWQNRIVLGCDDTANKEFLNRRKAKGHIAKPQSQSNLWFLEPEMLDRLGPVIGRGAVWLNDKVEANQPSDPFLLSGFQKRAVHLVTDRKTAVTIEIDAKGNGKWNKLVDLEVNGYHWYEFDQSLNATWVRLKSSESMDRATAWFHFSNEKAHSTKGSSKFSGLARNGSKAATGGLIRALDKDKRTLELAAMNKDGKIARYVLDASMKLKPEGGNESWNRLQSNAVIPSRKGILEVDNASVIYTDDSGKRFRLPKNPDYIQPGQLGFGRLCREVATERDLFNCHGTFFELPAENAGGFSRVRPVSTHNLQINDYCSYRGLLVLSGVNMDATDDNRHIIRSTDDKAALWVGAIDDIWQLGKPVGVGGAWMKTEVKAGKYSDPYLMTGYDKKTLELTSSLSSRITAEVDISGMGDWHAFKTFDLKADKTLTYEFPEAFQAYWIRFKADADITATAQLIYR